MPLTWAFFYGAGDGNRTRAVSLGIAANPGLELTEWSWPRTALTRENPEATRRDRTWIAWGLDVAVAEQRVRLRGLPSSAEGKRTDTDTRPGDCGDGASLEMRFENVELVDDDSDQILRPEIHDLSDENYRRPRRTRLGQECTEVGVRRQDDHVMRHRKFHDRGIWGARRFELTDVHGIKARLREQFGDAR